MNISNLDLISTTDTRKILLGMVPEVFDALNPETVCSDKMNSLKDSIGGDGKVYVLGFGKASVQMYRGVRNSLGKMIQSAWVIVPEDQETDDSYPELEVLRGTHPITGKKSVDSTEKVLEHISVLDENDTLVVLISGGGSALFESPVDGVNIEELAHASQCLMNADADIYELNTFRQFFSRVKGGKLASLVPKPRIISLIISDVFGDDISMIASGPLTQVKYDEEELYRIIEKYSPECDCLEKMKSRAYRNDGHDHGGRKPEQHLVLRNMDFVSRFCTILDRRNEQCVSFGSDVNGDVEKVADALLSTLRELSEIKNSGFWFVFGGETTVNVKGSGRGGRNQELALRFLGNTKDEDFTLMCIGTDGIDGMSPAMGAIVDSDLRAKLSADEIRDSLDRSDSFTLLDSHHSAIITGRTGTNVSDVAVGYFHPGRP